MPYIPKTTVKLSENS